VRGQELVWKLRTKIEWDILFTNGFEGFRLRRRLKEDTCIVTKDANHDHYDEDRKEDPVAKRWVQEQRLG
jgi:hypothetical protein